jgi:fibronectin type 3 domain-containing protein
MRKTFILGLVLLWGSSLVTTQTLVIEPYGISPRDASRDTTGYFDQAYNGLLNVGVETKMYFEGQFRDSTLTSPTWTLLSAPTNSVATLGTPLTIDEATEIVSFIPDVTGTYVIEFADGSTAATVTVNAGTYLGVSSGPATCELCHSEKYAEWEETGHYSIFEEGMNGILSDHYASYCIKCHTTGYNSAAINDGFDDRTQYVSIYGMDTTFVFPDSADLVDFYGSPDGHLYPGVYDSLLVFFPNSMELARIQCESCHGPGSEHIGVLGDSRIVATIGAENCAYCHDSGTHHVYPEQWDYSGHASPTRYPADHSNENPYYKTCLRCHTGYGFIQFVEGVNPYSPDFNNEYSPITCASCHDPHSDANPHQLRTVEATLANGEVVVEGGIGKLCMNCHQSRREANSYTDAPHSHYGPHYVPQADMLLGTNAVTFGQVLPTSPHISATANSCVDCHMYPGHVDEDGNVILVGSHTFNVVQGDTLDNVAICSSCHGDVGNSFAEKPYYFNGNADHDGDGVEEGVQEEVLGLMEQLAAMLPHADTTAGYDPHDPVDDTWTRTELKAAYNYEMVYYDRSKGIHNPAFTVALLKVSIQALLNNVIEGEIVAIDDVPNDQGKQVKIIWDKFADDGVAIDPIASYTIKRYDDYDDTWTGVGEHTADGSDRYALVVPTLFDSTADGVYWTTFKVVAISENGAVFESEPAEGYSVDNLIPQAPVNIMAAVANNDITVSWEAPPDPDINYYRVFRSTEPNFPADETTEIEATVELAYFDENMPPGNYYYKVVAVDFSGNVGELSQEVSAEVLSTDPEQIPIEYHLAQNYPNPFNPVTTIQFSLPENSHVTLTVYNALGQVVNVLLDNDMEIGYHSVTFSGDALPSGMYFYTLRANHYNATKKMILLK